ncbi:hypothetical protein DIC66_20010 [Rhodoferax lacus]|uniref:UPF0229 protein DIC66_20010 n=1 Tax=Rhodoferax lacus TaxID=2184758 RepID=A0A3E1R6X7_9BURK|nr:YeaH/YhbH family protein [Rhodoferax lacus]RFO95116.1 hypothetical protein DIC66_20010 [Rhodoferax lacus]
MALHIVDRRLAGKNKSIGNRERFLRRYKEQIREAVRGAVNQRGIRDLEQGETIQIPKKDIHEPVFQHGPGGVRDLVHPGNVDYQRGDRIARPPPSGGRGSGNQASDSGEGEDDFVFTLSREEFMDVFFEDLALPHLVRSQIGETPEFENRRAGHSRDGTPNNLDVVRSMRGALGRRLAMGAGLRRELADKRAELARLEAWDGSDGHALRRLGLEIRELQRRLKRIPFLDPLDLRFRARVQTPLPHIKAVMFCLMDVSGSMDEGRKSLSKQFFILLYLFLTRHYEKIDIVFIRHHSRAQEVDEATFFHTTETGGTVVSSALELMHTIITQRYPANEWNIYGAQASDGDNFNNDSVRCHEFLAHTLLPLCRYYAYVQVADEEQNLWQEYSHLQEAHANFAMQKATEAEQIYPVLRALFQKEAESA